VSDARGGAPGAPRPAPGPASSSGAAFTPADRAELEARGISLDEAMRQMALLAELEHFVALDRACTIGDGIVRLDAGTCAGYEAASAAIVAAGRCMRFVPASGAASRMFADLEAARVQPAPLDPKALAAAAAAGDQMAAALAAFLDGARRLALWDALAAQVTRSGGEAMRAIERGEYVPLLDALLGERGMHAAALPKGLLPFHHDTGGARTSFDEQLVEAAALVADRDGTVRAHFTVSPEHRAGFEAALAAARDRMPGTRFEIAFSAQSPATDTLATDEEGRPFRRSDGGLLFRPAGHGALIDNLKSLGGDLVLIKNIDNVVPDRLKPPTFVWSRILVGMLAEIERDGHDWVRRLEAGASAADLDAAEAFVSRTFEEGRPPAPGTGDRRATLLRTLARPIRICAMVRNTGEPGGGPYFVAGPGGARTRQIVESVQVRMSDSVQAKIFAGATHFNPVFIACALRDAHGRPYDLGKFVDPSAVITTRKSAEGRPLLALERPGLWNGAMADWNTVFVEAPAEIFNPVKTVLDLLRPEHQPA
jgi:hypothetical protein